jgi:hypothetical protein
VFRLAGIARSASPLPDHHPLVDKRARNEGGSQCDAPDFDVTAVWVESAPCRSTASHLRPASWDSSADLAASCSFLRVPASPNEMSGPSLVRDFPSWRWDVGHREKWSWPGPGLVAIRLARLDLSLSRPALPTHTFLSVASSPMDVEMAPFPPGRGDVDVVGRGRFVVSIGLPTCCQEGTWQGRASASWMKA